MSVSNRQPKILWVVPELLDEDGRVQESPTAILISEVTKLGAIVDVVTFTTRKSLSISSELAAQLGVTNSVVFHRSHLPRMPFARMCLFLGQSLILPKMPAPYLPFYSKRIVQAFEALFDGRVRKLKELGVSGEYSEINPDWDLVLYDGLEGSAHLFDGKRITLSEQMPPVLYRAPLVEADRWRGNASESSGTLYANYNATQAELIKEFELALLRKVTAVLSPSDRAAARFREALPRIQQHILPTAYRFSEAPLERTPVPGRFLSVIDFNIPGERGAVRWFLTEVWPEVVERAPERELVLVGKGSQKGLSRFRRLSGLTIIPWESVPTEEYLQCEALLIVGGESPEVRMEVFDAAAHHCPIISSPEGVSAFALKAGEHFEMVDGLSEWIIRLTQAYQPEQEACGGRLFELLSDRHNPEIVARKLLDAVSAECEKTDEEEEADVSSAF
jgi:hypothetical protein